MKNFVLTFLLLFSGGLARGQNDVTYFVDSNNGADAADRGTTRNDAWQTIAYAVSEAQNPSGGAIIVNVAPGTYNEPTILISEEVRLIGNEGVIVRPTEDTDTLFSFVSPGGLATVRFFTFRGTADGQTAIALSRADTFNIIGNTFDNIAVPIRLAESSLVVDVSQNVLTDFSTGILLEASSEADSLLIRNNSFTGASPDALAVNNESLLTVVDTEYNWWGQSENVSGLVSENVDYSPWLASGDEDPEAFGTGFNGDFSSVILGGSPSYDPDRNELQEAYNEEQTNTLAIRENATYDSLMAGRSATLQIAEENTVSINNAVVNMGTDSLFVDGQLFINQSLTLTSGNVKTVGDGSEVVLEEVVSDVSEANGRLVGRFVATSRNIGSERLSILGVDILPGEDIGKVAVTRLTGPQGIVDQNNNQSIAVSWTIDAERQPINGGRRLSLTWHESFDNEKLIDQAVVWRLTNGETQNWDPVSSELAASAPSSTNPNFRTANIQAPITALSTFTVSDAFSPLPVTLTDFTARLDESSVRLRWTTASETNSDYFRAERSTDGFIYEPLGRTRAAGESQQEQHYLYIDEGVTNRLSGIVYYRLKMVDFDGSFEYSPTVAVSLSGNAPLLVYANRRGTFKLFADLPEPDYTIQVSDLSGQIVYQAPLSAQSDVREYALSVPQLASSIYTLRCIGFQDVQVGRFRVE